MPTLRNRKDADAAAEPASGGWSSSSNTAEEPAKGPAFAPSSSTQYYTTQSENKPARGLCWAHPSFDTPTNTAVSRRSRATSCDYADVPALWWCNVVFLLPSSLFVTDRHTVTRPLFGWALDTPVSPLARTFYYLCILLLTFYDHCFVFWWSIWAHHYMGEEKVDREGSGFGGRKVGATDDAEGTVCGRETE